MACFGCPWTGFGVPFGVPWGSLANPLRVPEGALGCLGVPRAIFSDLWKIGRPIPSKCVYLHAPAHKKWPRGIHPSQSVATPGSPQTGARAAVPNPTSRAGGQDDVSLEQTPSNKDLFFQVRPKSQKSQKTKHRTHTGIPECRCESNGNNGFV